MFIIRFLFFQGGTWQIRPWLVSAAVAALIILLSLAVLETFILLLGAYRLSLPIVLFGLPEKFLSLARTLQHAL